MKPKQERTATSFGRPTKFNAATVRLISRLVANGMNYNLAAQAAGIHRDTLDEWKNTRPDFSATLEKAQAQGIASRLERIGRAAQRGCWQADAWWLERVHPELFAKKERSTVVIEKDRAALGQVTIVELPPNGREPYPQATDQEPMPADRTTISEAEGE
jgi:hypothetical protein